MAFSWGFVPAQASTFSIVERKMIKLARTIKCLLDESKWCSADMEAVRTSPYDNHKSIEPGVVLQDRPARPGDADQLRKTPTSRHIYIYIYRARISESMVTQLVAQNVTMKGDMVPVERPTATQTHAERE